MDNLFSDKQTKTHRPRTFKMKRAQLNHLETLRELAQQHKNENEATPSTSSQASQEKF